MEPMFSIRRALTWMCIYRGEETPDLLTKIYYIIFISVIIGLNATGVAAVLALGMEEALFTALNFPALLALIYTILSAFYLRHGIVHIFERLSHICKECKISL